ELCPASLPDALPICEQWAIWWRYRRWHGIEPGTWCAYFGGRSLVPFKASKPPFWRYNIPARQVMFSAYHMSPENLRAYVDELRRSDEHTSELQSREK